MPDASSKVKITIEGRLRHRVFINFLFFKVALERTYDMSESVSVPSIGTAYEGAIQLPGPLDFKYQIYHYMDKASRASVELVLDGTTFPLVGHSFDVPVDKVLPVRVSAGRAGVWFDGKIIIQ